MKIDFQETTNDLLKRIDIHSQYGARDIDLMLDVLQLKPDHDPRCWLRRGQTMLLVLSASDGQADILGTDVQNFWTRPEGTKFNNAVRFEL